MASVYTIASAAPSCDFSTLPSGKVQVITQVSDDGTGTLDSPGAPQPDQLQLVTATGQVRATTVAFGNGASNLTLVPSGSYTLYWVQSSSGQVFASTTVLINCGLPLVLDFLLPTDADATNVGKITGQATGGTPPLSFSIVQLGLTIAAQSGVSLTESNIPPSTYDCEFTDIQGQKATGKVTVKAYASAPILGCTDPAADNYDATATQDDGSCTYTPPVRVPYFDVPVMQSLRFVVPGSTIRPAVDNVLLADETPLDYTNPGYCQKVELTDKLVIQALSNYQGVPVLKLYDEAQNVALTTLGVRVQQGAGVTQAFEVYAKADAVAGFTRVYFNADALPLPFLPGQRVTISSTGTALDGTYPIHDVLEDLAAAVPYLRLAKTYPSGMIRLDGSLTTTYVVQQYDTYQFVLDFAGASILSGCYTAKITAIDSDFGTALAVSEPIDLAEVHPGTLLLLYRNFDNDFRLNYSSGLVNKQRFSGRLFDRKPATDKTVLRNDDSELVMLKAAAYRKLELEALLLPGWLHEVLAVAFCHDFVKLRGDEVILEGEYTFEDVERYTLGKGTALVEVKNFLGAGNRDDLGDVDKGGPYLVANGHFLIANP